MDWGSLLARRVKQDSTANGGWSMTHWVTTTTELMNPLANTLLDTRGKSGGFYGWPEDAEIESMRNGFAQETAADVQKTISTAIQKRAYDVMTHIPGGQFRQPVSHSKSLTNIVHAPAPLFWNVEKTA
jgi:peptide/nickel transport system substrate-binding protein